MLAAQRAARVQPPPSKKKAQGSTRGSEERQTSVSAAAPRGQKRMRDNDLEKVILPLPLFNTVELTDCFEGRSVPEQASRQDSHAGQAQEPSG